MMTDGLKRFTVSRKLQPRLLTGGNCTDAETGKGHMRLSERAGGDLDVAGPKDAAKIRCVTDRRSKALQRGVLVAEGRKELEREFFSVKGLFGQFGNGLFDLDSVH